MVSKLQSPSEILCTPPTLTIVADYY
jgi:hypothetical protein